MSHIGIYRSDQQSYYVSSLGWLKTVYQASPDEAHSQGYAQRNSGWLDTVYGKNEEDLRHQGRMPEARTNLERPQNSFNASNYGLLAALPAIMEEEGKRGTSFMGQIMGHHLQPGNSMNVRKVDSPCSLRDQGSPAGALSDPRTPGSPTPSLFDLPKDLDVSSSDSDVEMNTSYWLLPMPPPHARLSAPETWSPKRCAPKCVAVKRNGAVQYEEIAHDRRSNLAKPVPASLPGRPLGPVLHVEKPVHIGDEIKLREALEHLALSRSNSEVEETSKESSVKDASSPLPWHCTDKGSQASISTPRSMKMRHVLHGELRGLEQELQVLTEDLDIPCHEPDTEPHLEARRRTAACKVAARIRCINQLLDIDVPRLEKDTKDLTKDLENLRTLVRSRSLSPVSTPPVSQVATRPCPSDVDLT